MIVTVSGLPALLTVVMAMGVFGALAFATPAQTGVTAGWVAVSTMGVSVGIGVLVGVGDGILTTRGRKFWGRPPTIWVGVAVMSCWMPCSAS